jgi:hypothetical protein
MEYNYGFSVSEINEIEKLVVENKKIIIEQLVKFYAGKKSSQSVYKRQVKKSTMDLIGCECLKLLLIIIIY